MITYSSCLQNQMITYWLPCRQMITYSLSSLICPLIGGWLAQRHLRLPFVVTAALYAVNGLIFVPQVPETIPDSKRTSRLSIAGASPLSAVKLFTRGARLRKVALLQVVHSFGSNNYNIEDIHKMQVTGWDTQQRGRFESYRAIFSCLGFSQMSWIIGRFGNLGSGTFGVRTRFGNLRYRALGL